jgi:hypothetical protein
MNMKLENIIKQVINEAVTPVQFLMKAIKGLGKGAVEAENALIRAIRKEGNLSSKAAVDINNVSEDILNKSIKNVEFATYRKLIAQKLYNKNQEIFDDIISKSTGKTRVLQLNNAGIPPAFQEEVRNMSNLKRRTIKPTPTTPTPTTAQTTITDLSSIYSKYESELSELDDYLWKRVNRSNPLRQFFAINRINRSNWSNFRNELLNNLNSKLNSSLNKKMELKLNEIKPFLEGLDANVQNQANSKKIIEESVLKFKEILNEQSKQLGAYSSFFNKLTPNSLTSFRNYLSGKGTWKQFAEDYMGQFKLTLALMSFGTLGEILAGDLNSWEEIKNELDLRYLTIPIPGINVWTWGINAIYRWLKIGYKSINKKVEPGTEPFMDNQTGNTDDLEGIKN